MIGEPWNTILFIAVIPLLHQGFKLLAEKYGYVFGKVANQVISLVLAGIFVFASGGFAGLALPKWDNDLIQFIGDILKLVGAGWGSLMVLYEAIWDKLFVKLKLATADKY